MKRTSKSGFTLIELLIVVAIIGLLSSITLVGLGSFRARGRDARRIADLQQVQNGLELYYAAKSAYPPTTDSGTACGGADWTSMTSDIIGANVGVTSLPCLDPSNQPYSYAADTARQKYVLKATLENSSDPSLSSSPHGSNLNGTSISCGAADYCVQF